MEVSPRWLPSGDIEKQHRMGCVQLLVYFTVSASVAVGGDSTFDGCPYHCEEMCRE
jgi:hypothetical protein